MKYWKFGQGPAILFLHGIPTGGRLWDLVVERLQKHFTCIVVDLPGFGQSPPPDMTVPDPQLYALERLPEQTDLTPNERVWLEAQVRDRLGQRDQARKLMNAALVTEPLGPLPAGMDPADAAAWTVVANVLLNLDGVMTKG